MINTIRKRSGEVVAFQPEKITRAIYKAAVAVGGSDWGRAEELTEQVVVLANAQFPDGTAEVEKVQDLVEKVLIENGHAKTSKAYILYREKRRQRARGERPDRRDDRHVLQVHGGRRLARQGKRQRPEIDRGHEQLHPRDVHQAVLAA